MRPRNLLSLLALVAATVTLAAPPASAEAKEEKKPCEKGDTREECKPAANAPVAFTNDDLDRLFGHSSAPAVSVEEATRAKEGAAPDYLGAMQEGQARQMNRDRNVLAARARLTEAETRLEELESRSIQIANPFLPRPELSPEEAKAWADKDNVERMKANQAEIEQARRDVERARAALAHAEAGGE
jgi:hypothetical protein